MNITIEINTDNDAFQYGNVNFEIQRILLILADPDNDLSFPRRHHLWDINGNVCGFIEISEND